MNITDFKDSIDYLVKAELTPFIWGHAGIGKSSIVRQYAESKGYHFFPFYLGTQSDIGDILGLAEFVTNKDGSKSTEFAIPKWLKNTVEYCEENPDSGAVIFLDEFNRARRDILSGMFSLALDKTFHTLKLPKNCHIIAAGNPPTSEHYVTDVNDTALLSRFVHIKLEPTIEEWVKYAKENKIHPSLIGFIQEQPQLLHASKEDYELPVKPDPRAIERVNKLFRLETPRNLLEQLMQGILGLERTVAFLQYEKESDKPLSGRDVLEGKNKKLISKWSDLTDAQASLLNITADNLIEVLNKLGEGSKMLSAPEKKNFMFFLSTIPKDISYPVIKKLIDSRNVAFKNFYLDPLYESPVRDIVLVAKSKVVPPEET